MKRAIQKGFTLIELMIVVAIIGILAAIALPAYQDYMTRSQVSEAATLTGGLKVAVSDYYAAYGEFPANLTQAICGKNASGTCAGATAASTTGTYVEGVTVGTNGVISATMNNTKANKAIWGGVLTLTPTTDGGSIKWTCTSTGASAIAAKYLPQSCK